MNGQRIRKISIWLITALYLLACISPSIAASTTSPTQAPVETIIVQTAAAAQTQTAILLPTVTLTPTPTSTLTPTKTPTSTPTFIPLTSLTSFATTSVTATVTPTGTIVTAQAGTDSSGGGTGDKNDDSNDKEKSGYSSVIDKEWACTVSEKYPPNGTVIGRGARFSAVWKLLNRGIKTWPIHSVDFLFIAGLRNEGRARFDLPLNVISGGTITLDVTIIAPKNPGAYRSIWTLRVGRTYFCQMGINFVVK